MYYDVRPFPLPFVQLILVGVKRTHKMATKKLLEPANEITSTHLVYMYRSEFGSELFSYFILVQ